MNTLPSTPPWQDDWLQPEKRPSRVQSNLHEMHGPDGATSGWPATGARYRRKIVMGEQGGKKPTAKKRVPGEITEKIRRSWKREVELDPQLCPEEIMSREVALGWASSGRRSCFELSRQVVRQQRCNGHCLSDSVQHSSWKSNCAVHKSLGNGEGTPPYFHCSGGGPRSLRSFSGGFRGRAFHSLVPFPLCPRP